MLLAILIGCSVVLLTKILWARRHFYYLSWKTPGPFALPLIGNMWQFRDASDVIGFAKKLRTKYGSPVRIWLNGSCILAFDTPEEIQSILSSLNFLERSPQTRKLEMIIGGHGIMTSSEESWKKIRKSLGPSLLNYNMLNSFYPKFNKNLGRLIDLLEDKVGIGQFNIYNMLAVQFRPPLYTEQSSFGVSKNAQSGQSKAFLEALNDALTNLYSLILKPWLYLRPIYRLTKYYGLFEENKRELRSHVKKILDAKVIEFQKNEMQNKSEPVDEFVRKETNIYADVCVRLLREKRLTEDEVISELASILVAGFESSALHWSYIVLYLAMYPEYQEKVFKEIREIFPDQRSEVTAEDIAKLEYTNRFINESLRISSVVPILGRVSAADTKIDGFHIPKGTEVSLALFNLHRNPDIWGENAEVFDPDHFLPEVLQKQHPHCFMPFAAGPRNCLGYKYAQIAARTFTCWMVRNYRFTTNLKLEQLTYDYGMTLKLNQGHMVEVHKRENY